MKKEGKNQTANGKKRRKIVCTSSESEVIGHDKTAIAFITIFTIHVVKFNKYR